MKKLFIYTSIIFFFCSENLPAQIKIFGKISDQNSEPLTAVNVTIRFAKTQTILAFTFTDKNGHYSVNINTPGDFQVDFSSISYKKKTGLIEIKTGEAYELNQILIAEDFKLNEVIIQAKRPITTKGDTIIFDANFFAKGNENVVEDLLKRIPGLSVSKDGTIWIGNQEVEKIMVEGDDFFEKGYRVLTKNMKANTIGSVEVYKKYSNNRLLKGIENSDRVAINLKLKDSLKRQFFGDLNLGYGINNNFDNHLNVMSFGEKMKIYMLGNANNVGNDVTGELNSLIYPSNSEAIGNIGDDINNKKLFSFSIPVNNLNNDRADFTTTKLASVNLIFNLNKNLKLKLTNLFNRGSNRFINDGYDQFRLGSDVYVNKIDNMISGRQFTNFNKLDLIFDISKTQMLTVNSKLKLGKENLDNNLNLNDVLNINNLQNDDSLIDYDFKYTDKYNDSSALILTGRYIKQNSLQNFQSNNFLFANLLNLSNISSTNQDINNKTQYIGIEINLIGKSAVNFKSGFQLSQDLLTSRLSFEEDKENAHISDLYSNYLNYNVGDIYAGIKYSYKFGKAIIFTDSEIHQLLNFKKTVEYSNHQYPIYINPKVGFNWIINENNKVTSHYSYNKKNSGIDDIYENYLLTDYNTFSKGAKSFNQLESSTFLTNFTTGNFSSLVFANINFLYLKYFNFFASNYILQKNYTQIEKIKVKNKMLFSFSSDLSFALKKIKNNLKVDVGFSASTYKNQVNSGPIINFKADSYNWGMELHSVFDGFFNYEIGANWAISKIKSTETKLTADNASFAKVTAKISDKINLAIRSELYRFSFEHKKMQYSFVDFNANYIIKKNKINIGISGKNLTNTLKYVSQSISDIVIYSRSYHLRPRMLIFNTEFNF